jgi:hypothetical protein
LKACGPYWAGWITHHIKISPNEAHYKRQFESPDGARFCRKKTHDRQVIFFYGIGQLPMPQENAVSGLLSALQETSPAAGGWHHAAIEKGLPQCGSSG